MSRVLVTGAAGFLGRAAVHQALLAGHTVRAQVRSVSAALPADVEQVVADLRIDDLEPLARDVDVVIHLAAAKGGDYHTQYASTVKGTERLLAVTGSARRVVLCSSFAVYAYGRLAAGSLVTEDAPLDDDNEQRDAYAQTKVVQERVVRRACAERGQELVVVRPGVVYGPGAWWTYRIGEKFGRLWVALGNAAQVPLVHVDDCAQALVVCATAATAAGRTFNVLSPSSPTQREFRRALARVTSPRPLVLPVPWPLARSGAAVVEAAVSRASGSWKLPGFLVPDSLAVRAKPLRFTSQPLLDLGWRPVHDWHEDLSTDGARG